METITREKLNKLYQKNSNRSICQTLGISHPTLVTMLKRAGVTLKGKGNRNTKVKIKVI